MDIITGHPELSLVILALIDSTSIGTLVIPLWLLLRGRREAIAKVLAYLLVIAGFYWVIGVLMRSGLLLIDPSFFEHRLVRLAGMAIGALMVIWALAYRTDAQKAASARKKAAARVGAGPEARAPESTAATEQVPRRLRGRVGAALDTRTGLIALALFAGLLELPTMLPYLAAVGVMQGAGWGTSVQLLALAGYCLVMIVPALALVGARALAGARIELWMQKLGDKAGAYAQETLGWVVGIGGFLLIRASLSGQDLHSLFG
ncbi:GAP family protein [Glutamicibacter sp. JL.03c]|uniref:GAP family protein n=1 Tax=Glutamicibacter sp. JL.03c TaxID=2984842 RepID=UPI0021F7F737|nr:GAP family protein [Glutamicibacter sp. JL.03c]UYQ78237.1 GAP family protein [Glutamicibacter sp. JL.03c]